jgi:hypothetical protein
MTSRCSANKTKIRKQEVYNISQNLHEEKTDDAEYTHTFIPASKGKGKGQGQGKAVPLQVWSGPEGSRKLRFPDYMTTAQKGDKFVSLTHRLPLSPGNVPGTHFC